MSKKKRPDRARGMTKVRARLDEKSLPNWLNQPLKPHEPTYNPTIEVGRVRMGLIWATASHPLACFLGLLAPLVLAWVVFGVVSIERENDTLNVLAVFELPLLVGLLFTLWPRLLYRLAGFPPPALRPSSRSAVQTMARTYYQDASFMWLFLLVNAVVLVVWSLAFLSLRSDSTFDGWAILAVTLLALPVVGPVIWACVAALWRLGRLFGAPRNHATRQRGRQHHQHAHGMPSDEPAADA
jgi:hypothetical protein